MDMTTKSSGPLTRAREISQAPSEGALNRLAALLSRNGDIEAHQENILRRTQGQEPYEPPPSVYSSSVGLNEMLDVLEKQIGERESQNGRLAAYL